MKYSEMHHQSAPVYQKSIEQIQLENPIRNTPAILEEYFGGMLVRCGCGNEFEYLQDQVNCPRCIRIFVVAEAEDEAHQ